MRVLFCLPPTKVSHELDFVRAIPGAQLLVAAEHEHPEADRSFPLAARRLPYVGSPERWTAALAWLRDLTQLEPGLVDVVVSPELNNVGSVQANRLARRLGVPHVVTIFETLAPYPLFRVPPWRQFSQSISRSADGFVCFTERARRHAIASGCAAEKCVAIHPGLDLERFSPLGRRTEEPVVLFVGELRRDKGVLRVLAACQRLVARGLRLKLVIVGDGQLRGRVERAADAASWVEFRGARPRAEIPTILRSARVFVLAPKRRRIWEEQFGWAYVEAMATALPVVTTACGAVEEVVPPWNPIVADESEDALGNGISAALGPDGNGWGVRNRDVATARFDIRLQGAALGRALQRVVAAECAK